MKKILFTLVVIGLIAVGADEYVNRNSLRVPFLSQPQRQRVITPRQSQPTPNLKAPGDVSRETRRVVVKRPIRYHGFFNSKNKAAYLQQVRLTALRDINRERGKRGLPHLKLDNSLNRIAGMRAAQANRNFNHYDGSGKALSALDAAKTGFSSSYLQARSHISECLSEQAGDVDNTAAQVANTAVHGMIYHDAGSHWGHRKILLDPNNFRIGITAYVDKAKDNKVVVAYDLYQ